MSVLETFIHDPLCEWTKSTSSRTSKSAAAAAAAATTHDDLLDNLNQHNTEIGRRKLMTISKKLQGLTIQTSTTTAANGNGGGGTSTNAGTTLNMSVEAQVHELISQAVDKKNLSAMYFGKKKGGGGGGKGMEISPPLFHPGTKITTFISGWAAYL